MSALDWGGGVGVNATPRYYSFTSPSLPDSDWSIGIWVRRLAVTGSGVQMLWRMGAGSGSDSMYIYMGETTTGVLWGSEITNAAGTNWINTGGAGAAVQDGLDYLVIVQRRSGVCEVYYVQEGAPAVISNSQPGVSGTFTSKASSLIGNGGGGQQTRNPLGEFFIFDNRSLSAAEITALAQGSVPTTIAAPVVYLPFRSGEKATETNLGSGGSAYDATRVSSGFTTTTDFFATGPFPLVPAPVLRKPGTPAPISLYSAAGWFGKHTEARRWFSNFLIAPTPSAGTTITTTTGDAAADGIAAAIDQKRAISTSVGNAIGAGATAAIDQKRSVATATGNAVADGTTAVINAARVIATTTGDATAAGATATINGARVIQTSAGNAAADGVTASLNQATTIATTVGNAVAAGATAAIDQARKVATVTGDATAAGTTARVDQARVILTSPGDAVADGVPAVITSSVPVTIVCTSGDAGADGVTALIVSTPLQPDGPFIAAGRQLLNELEVEMLLDRERLEASDIDVLEILTNLFALEVFE